MKRTVPCLALLAWLCLVVAPASAATPQSPSPITERLAAISEMNRFVPEKALPMLLGIEAEARAATPGDKTVFLSELCSAYRRLLKYEQALGACDELIEFGRAHHDNVALANGLLRKGTVKFYLNDLPAAHKLIWEAERLAATTADTRLRTYATVASGQSYSEEGNLPFALARLQAAAVLARQQDDPVPMLEVQAALAVLYAQMHEYEKGFAVLDEARVLARQASKIGWLARMHGVEASLAVRSGQSQRAMRAQLAELKLWRQLGAEAMVGTSLVNVTNAYLKLHDYQRAVVYGEQAVAAASGHDDVVLATARLNLGEAYLGMGRLAEGKRSMEAGVAAYEKGGDKPELQGVLLGYGETLEHAGDLAGALKAYHRERALSNELFEQRRQKALLELQEKYEADKKGQQIELLRRENQVKSAEIDYGRLQRQLAVLCGMVFALAAIIVGFLYRKVRHANAALQEKNLELKQQSTRDPLTGLYNRRHFQDFMREHKQVERRGAGTSGEEVVGALFLLDVDHFKHVNDTYGHATGDAVLKATADSLREILRETDMIVRWGGEEFLAFVPAITRSGLDDMAKRLLAGIAATSIQSQGATLSVHVSVGFATYPLAFGRTPLPWERVVNLIDMALYLAKANGRNRAYGVRGFAQVEDTSMEEIEQDLERAWQDGFVDLSIVLAGRPDLRVHASA